MKLRALAALHAMLRPKRLRSVAQLSLLKRLFSRMGASEGRMPLRMPILREDNMLKLRRDCVNQWNHGVSARNGKFPAGTEIILHIDDYENVLRGDLHTGHEAIPTICSL